MRKLQFTIAAFILFFAITASAQVSVNVNIGSRPDWCSNYNDDVEYVYLPEIECYYDVHSSVYIYYGPRGWIRSSYLPEYCHNYDVYRGPRIVIDYRGNAPYAHFDSHRSRYYRSHYRNYRNEYYGPRDHHRTVVYNNYGHDNHHNNHGYRRDSHHDSGHRNGHGRGRGHGRR
jgi:hypothetical protein